MLSGTREEGSPSARRVWYEMDETTSITALGEGKHYKFLGVLENVRQDERLALACAAEEYLRRIFITWFSPLSDPVYRQLISMHSRRCGTYCEHSIGLFRS